MTIATSKTWKALIFLAAITGWSAADVHWEQYGRTCLHNPVVDGEAAPNLVQPRWTVSPDFELTAASAPVVFDGAVYVYGLAWDFSTSYLAACDVADGELKWQEPVDASVQDSWSTPAIDPASRSVLIGSGRKVFCLDADTGARRWVTDLDSDIVNSSITIAGGRAFLSDSTSIAGAYGGSPGKLFALNLGASPEHQPGDVLWTAPLGSSSGCTPAYDPETDLVIVGDCSGTIRACHASTGEQAWEYTVPQASDWKYTPGGTFWGAVSISGGYAYACTYCFYGGEDNSYLYKLNAATGELVWRTPSERSNSVPIVTGDIVLVSGGLEGYGVPKLEAFDNNTGAKLWEYTGVGGRDNTPVVVGTTCYIGDSPGLGGFYYEALVALDLALTPLDTGFVIDSYAGAGGSPAYANGSVYSVGDGGLCAFGELPPEHSWPIPGDANLDCTVNILDLIFVRNRIGREPSSENNWQADVNDDGKINILDLINVRNKLNTRCGT